MPKGDSKKCKYPYVWKHSYSGRLIAGRNEYKMPPLAILKWLYRYEPDTGKIFKIREASGKLIIPEREITRTNRQGYIELAITDSDGLKLTMKAHRIAYYMNYGVEPTDTIDHWNGVRSDNRIDNLRLSSTKVNQRNKGMTSLNRTGIKGVSFDTSRNTYRAGIKIDGKQINLGNYKTPEEAYQARLDYVGRFNLQNLDEGFSYRHTNNPDSSL